ncbi:hypothetical protein BDV25DRAFT_141590 [Aspergillus avenaceus]|uniref:MARVEL domain-containing protein n=1 Tax=Aspergillus avenaceus TaxID=36643 RepID=A0A5N6TR66_ASPAV|nr:hypothetical protein BDV25DRAFT_141590 [Aspergillus avenaceus]
MDAIQLGIHLAQSIIAVIILGCSIYGLTISSTDGFGLAVVTAIATILVTVYIVTASFVAKGLYKVWLIIGANCVTGIFWLATVGKLAAEQTGGCGSHQHCYRKRDAGNHSIHAATIALSVIDCVLSVGCLVYTLYTKRNQRTKTPATE